MTLDHLINLISRLGHWGYLIIFLVAALECSAFLGLVVPGESIVLVSGFFAALGLLDLEDVIVIVAAGAILGDSIGYELGRHLGRSWLLRYGRWVGLRQAHIDRVDAFFERHGGKTIFIGRFIGFSGTRTFHSRFIPYALRPIPFLQCCRCHRLVYHICASGLFHGGELASCRALDRSRQRDRGWCLTPCNRAGLAVAVAGSPRG